MSKKALSFVVFFLSLVFIAGSFTYPVYSCDSANTLPKGKSSVEVDWERIRYRNGDLDIYNHNYFYYGITDNLQLKLVQPFLNQQNAATGAIYNGRADTTLQFNYRFQNETKTRPGLAVELYTDFNNARDLPSAAGHGDYGITFVMSKNFTDKFEGEFNLCHQINTPTHINQINYESALQTKITDNILLRCEYRGKAFMNNTNWSELYLFPGFQFNEHIYFAPKYVVGLNDDSPKNHYILDLVINF
ncbi:MAG: hypothetical protein ABIH00_04100 [Armatimonadota bacterium]